MSSEEEKDPLENVKAVMGELEELLDLKKEIDEFISSHTQKEAEAIEGFEKEIEAIRGKIEVAKAAMREKLPEAFDDLVRVEQDLSHKDSALKSLVHSLPVSMVKDGLTIKAGRVKVSSSKVTIETSYREELLDDHPEYEEMYVDGDPLIRRAINPAVLERLVADGDIPEDDVKDYRIERKVRNPQVRIREEVDGQ